MTKTFLFLVVTRFQWSTGFSRLAYYLTKIAFYAYSIFLLIIFSAAQNLLIHSFKIYDIFYDKLEISDGKKLLYYTLCNLIIHMCKVIRPPRL